MTTTTRTVAVARIHLPQNVRVLDEAPRRGPCRID
jgi:hypothetical protein